jgi:hypothetical protein
MLTWPVIPHEEVEKSDLNRFHRGPSHECRQLVKLEIDLIATVKSQWGSILAERHTDPTIAEAALCDSYRYAELPEPNIIWAENPLNAFMILLNRPDLVDVGAKILGKIWNSAHAEIYHHIRPDSVRYAMAYTNPRAEIIGDLGKIDFDPLGEDLNVALRKRIGQIYPAFNLNSIPLALQDYRVAYLSYFDFFQQIGIDIPQAQMTIDLAQSCGWCWAFENLAILCPKFSRIAYNSQGEIVTIEYDGLNILSGK